METGIIVPVVILSVMYQLAHITHNRRENLVLNVLVMSGRQYSLCLHRLKYPSQLYRCNVSLVMHEQNK